MRQAALFQAGRFGARFCSNVVTMRNVEKVGNPSHQMVFMCADLPVGIGNLPHVFDDANLFGQLQLPVDEGRELVEIIGSRCRPVPQFGQLRHFRIR